MTSSTAYGVNYRETYFQHANLTPIRGEPKNDTLKTLLHECMANSQTVHSNLGGGAHGHLGLVLQPAKYAVIAPGTPYIRPVFPGTLVIPPNTTNIQAQMLSKQHREELRLFQETEAVHNTLVQQIVAAIDPMYLKSLRNPVTQAFMVPLSDILNHLMTVYGNLNPKKFLSTKNKMETFQYDLSLPVDVVFDPIDDLGELAIIAKQPMSEEQKCGLAFIIFQNTGKFKSDLKAWNRKPDNARTWANMKIHFREAHLAIRDVEDEPIANTFNQANMVNEVIEGLGTMVRDQVAEALPPIMQLQFPQMYVPPQQQLGQQQVNLVAGQMDQSPSLAFPPPYMPSTFEYANMVAPTPPYTPPPSQGNLMQHPPMNSNNPPGGFSNFGQRGRRNNCGRTGGRGGRYN